MGKYSGSSRSFNTLKHSNRAERSKRRVQSKYLILSICVVVVAILLSLLVFLVMAIANRGKEPAKPHSGETEFEVKEETYPHQDVYSGALLLVNKTHIYHFDDDRSDLVSTAGLYEAGYASNDTTKINREALTAFEAMMNEYVSISGKSDIFLTEAYRTKEQQENISKAIPGGYSDHHTGRLLTVKQKNGSGGITANNDLYEICAKHGFVVRYPANKSGKTGVADYTYAFRYVGVAHATYMQEHNLCLEEYIELLQQNYSEGERLAIDALDGHRYMVYAIKAEDGSTTFSVPSTLPYTVSGDNTGYFIITADCGKPE